MDKNLFTESEGYNIVLQWLRDKDFEPFSFQLQTWKSFSEGYSGMVVSPTGFGKTYSVFISVIIDYLNDPRKYKAGLKLLWITPLRSLAKDIAKAMQQAINEIGLDWHVAVRNGDTAVSERQRQSRNMPEILIITPESLHLLLAQKDNKRFFANLHCIAVDEWHELMASKRGVMVELALSFIRYYVPKVKIWGLTATIGNLDEAMHVLIPYAIRKKKIIASEKKKIDIISVFPDELEVLPWGGHMGTQMVDKIVPIIFASNSTLIFTNTRNKAEAWYQNLLNACPELAGVIAIHHSSIDHNLRIWIEDALSLGSLKAVISTSSLDLGVDFKPVDTVIQIGSAKGIARFLQRAGRSGHSPFEVSKIYFVPTHSLELMEAAALKDAYRTKVVESRIPVILPIDLLVQFVITLAVGDGFYPEKLLHIIRETHAFQMLTDEEWDWILTFVTKGGELLSSYEEFHKVVVKENGLYKVESRRIAMLHRLNIGAIVSDAMLKVKFISGGYIGMVEEYFIAKLKPGDSFVLAGRILEMVMIKDLTVLVRLSKVKNAVAPSWLGGRLPLTSHLSDFLRKKFNEAEHPKSSDKELVFLKPLMQKQKQHSHIPHSDEFLVEYMQAKDGFHFFAYPFEGRLIHEIMGALIAYRISKIKQISFSIAMNDYGFELLSDQPFDIDETTMKNLFSRENIMMDVTSAINATEMARRKFRDIACISGLVLQSYLGMQKNNKSLQVSSNLIFNVLEEYDKRNLLLRQAYNEVFFQQIEEERLIAAFNRINQSQIILKKPDRLTPLSFPIKAESLRQSISNEGFATKMRKLQEANTRKK